MVCTRKALTVGILLSSGDGYLSVVSINVKN